MSSVVEMIPMIQALTAADQWAMLEQLVSVLKGAGPLKVKPSKASKKAKALDENGEPKEKRAVRPDSYIHLLHKVVSPALTAMAEITEDEAEKKMLKSVTARAQIAKTLYETVKAVTNEDKTVESEMRATAIMEISKESVADAFQSWKADPPAVEYKGKKAAKAAAAAAASAATASAATVAASAATATVEPTATELYLGTAPSAAPSATVVAAPKIVKVVKPKVEKVAKPVLSEEEKAAKKKAAAKVAYEKAKAKKAAEKAAAAAAPAVATATVAAATVASAAPEVVEEVSCDPYAWTHNFGKGDRVYERIDFDGVAYIYEADSKAYLGVFQEATNSLDLSIADPTAE